MSHQVLPTSRTDSTNDPTVESATVAVGVAGRPAASTTPGVGAASSRKVGSSTIQPSHAFGIAAIFMNALGIALASNALMSVGCSSNADPGDVASRGGVVGVVPAATGAIGPGAAEVMLDDTGTSSDEGSPGVQRVPRRKSQAPSAPRDTSGVPPGPATHM